MFRLSEARKVAGRWRIAFNLPPLESCIGKTRVCEKACYGLTGRFPTAAVQRVLQENWATLRAYEARRDAPRAALELAYLLHRPVCRIHSVGDFHSPFAVQVWRRVAHLRRDIFFWCYTRSFCLDMRALASLPNVRVWASTDYCNVKDAVAFARRTPRVGHAISPWSSTAPIPPGSIFCRALHPDPARAIGHDGACLECRLCMPSLGGVGRDFTKNIVFPLHSRGGGRRLVDDGLSFADRCARLAALN